MGEKVMQKVSKKLRVIHIKSKMLKIKFIIKVDLMVKKQLLLEK